MGSLPMGGGWLISTAPPAEIGVHPAEPEDRGFGIAVMMQLPGDCPVQLYEPRHPMAINL